MLSLFEVAETMYKAAILAAKKAEFNPSDIEITMFNKWFLLTIYVQRPTPEYQQQYQNY